MGLRDAIVSTVETYLVPVRLQQLYKGYFLREATLGQIGMPLDLLTSVARLADHVYLTGTRSGHSTSLDHETKLREAISTSLKDELGVRFQNYVDVSRFDAATGMLFETNGPFGATIVSAVPPGQESIEVKGDRSRSSYRMFLVFRGTVNELAPPYLDDASTDAKALWVSRESTIGRQKGRLARGFFQTYLSCRRRVLTQELRWGYEALNAFYRQIDAGSKAAGRRLPWDRVELYVVGHSLGGAVASLCAYDIASLFPGLYPTLITFGSPPVGDVDFALDFHEVMVARAPYHPKTRFLRSMRFVSRTAKGVEDRVATLPEYIPNLIHVNTRITLPSVAEGLLLQSHSMKSSYLESIMKLNRKP